MDSFYIKESIYTRIEKILEDKGYIPEDFILEQEEQTEGEIFFASGALEGILGHHSAGNGENEDAKKIAAFIKQHSDEEPIQTVITYEQEWKKQKTAVVRDALLQEIIEHAEMYDANQIVEIAYAMMIEGRHVETVKMGLTFMALFDMSKNEKVKKVFITLGSCEDFTEYVLVNISDWAEEEKNKAYFTFAKTLNGWGKINAVECLQPDIEEIKEWILCEGCKNSILYNYLGLECARKCEYKERLKAGNLNEKEKQGASDIMDGLLGEGPCAGISGLEAPNETIYWYLCAMHDRKIEIKWVEQLFRIENYLEEDGKGETEVVDEWKKKSIEKLTELFANIDLKNVILEGLAEEPYRTVHLAIAKHIDISEKLMELMQTEFKTYYYQGYYFLTQGIKAKEYIELSERHLDHAKLPKGMGKQLGVGKKSHWDIDMVTQYLDRYPYLGQQLLEVSICSPYTRWRNMAAKALEAWKETLHKELQEISPKLYSTVLEIEKLECDEELKKRWKALI